MNSRRRARITLSVFSALSAVLFFIFIPESENICWQHSQITAKKQPQLEYIQEKSVDENSSVNIADMDNEPLASASAVSLIDGVGDDQWQNDVIIDYKFSSKTDNSAQPLTFADKRAVPVFWQVQYLPADQAYLHSHEKAVRGVAIGYALPQQEISGVSLAFMHMYNRKKSGFSVSLLDVSQETSGFALFAVGGAVVNNGFLMGLWNMTEENRGIQLGLINREERNSIIEYDFKPNQGDEKFGVQAGLVNYSDSPGVQFGLWNTNPNSWIKHFPLFNICF